MIQVNFFLPRGYHGGKNDGGVVYFLALWTLFFVIRTLEPPAQTPGNVFGEGALIISKQQQKQQKRNSNWNIIRLHDATG